MSLANNGGDFTRSVVVGATAGFIALVVAVILTGELASVANVSLWLVRVAVLLLLVAIVTNIATAFGTS